MTIITAKEAREQISAIMNNWVKNDYQSWFNTQLRAIKKAVKSGQESVMVQAPVFVSDDLFHELMDKFRASPYNFHVSDFRNKFENSVLMTFKVSW